MIEHLADGLRIPLWRETTVGGELARLRMSAVYRGIDVPQGDGGPVMLIPGLFAGDASLRRLAGWLERNGHRAHHAGIRVNADCAERAVTAIERRVAAIADAAGRPVTLVGQSRGGMLARAVAHRSPGLVEQLITLGTPHAEPLAAHTAVLGSVLVMGTAGSIGLPGVFRWSCLRGDCCAGLRRDVAEPVTVPFTSIYSRRDGIVDWRACLAEGAEHVEVRASHIGMAINHEVYAAVAATLAGVPCMTPSVCSAAPGTGAGGTACRR
jgi:triacylglycerol lipase